MSAEPSSQWLVERHDHEDGDISYEVWSAEPYAFLFGIYQRLTPDAKAIAESIVRDHNRAPGLLAALRFFANIGIGSNEDYRPEIRLPREAIIAAREAVDEATKTEV